MEMEREGYERGTKDEELRDKERRGGSWNEPQMSYNCNTALCRVLSRLAAGSSHTQVSPSLRGREGKFLSSPTARSVSLTQGLGPDRSLLL